MEILFALPGVFLTILFAVVERNFELRGIPESERRVAIETLFIAIILSFIVTLGLTYLLLATDLMTVYDLVTMFFGTLVMWLVLTWIGFGRWVARKLLPNRPKSAR